jgi:hypothetical protein
MSRDAALNTVYKEMSWKDTSIVSDLFGKGLIPTLEFVWKSGENLGPNNWSLSQDSNPVPETHLEMLEYSASQDTNPVLKPQLRSP